MPRTIPVKSDPIWPRRLTMTATLDPRSRKAVVKGSTTSFWLPTHPPIMDPMAGPIGPRNGIKADPNAAPSKGPAPSANDCAKSLPWNKEIIEVITAPNMASFPKNPSKNPVNLGPIFLKYVPNLVKKAPKFIIPLATAGVIALVGKAPATLAGGSIRRASVITSPVFPRSTTFVGTTLRVKRFFAPFSKVSGLLNNISNSLVTPAVIAPEISGIPTVNAVKILISNGAALNAVIKRLPISLNRDLKISLTPLEPPASSHPFLRPAAKGPALTRSVAPDIISPTILMAPPTTFPMNSPIAFINPESNNLPITSFKMDPKFALGSCSFSEIVLKSFVVILPNSAKILVNAKIAPRASAVELITGFFKSLNPCTYFT